MLMTTPWRTPPRTKSDFLKPKENQRQLKGREISGQVSIPRQSVQRLRGGRELSRGGNQALPPFFSL